MRVRGWRRTGFTLVEILIVVAIIAVLLGAITAATSAMLRASRSGATERTIKATYMLLDSRWKDVREEAGRDSVPASVVSMAGNNNDRAKQLWIKIRLKEAFPVNFAEIQNCYSDALTSQIPAGLRRYNAAHKQALAKRDTAVAATWEAQSSACLLIALASSRSGAGVDDDALGVNWRDTDADRLKEVVDGWGRPIVFYRFPVGTDLQTANPAPGTANPLHSLPAGAGRTQFESNGHRLTVGGQNAYTIPVLVSGGPDGRTGMTANTTAPYDQFSAGAVNDTQDNYFSYKLGVGP